VTFEGSAVNGSTYAFAIDLSDDWSIFEAAQYQQNITVSYNGYETIGEESVTAIYWSDADDCDLLSETVLSIQDAIVDVNFTVAPLAFTDNNFTVTVYVIGGTDTTVEIDPGDGSLSSCEVSSGLSVLTYDLVYENPGQFELIVSAYNEVTDISRSRMIDVYELTIFGNTTVLVPPGSGTWGVSVVTDQGPLEDVVCLWSMGINYQNITYTTDTELNSSVQHEVAFSYEEADVGMQTITANCSNAVFSQSLTMDVEVIWDNVTLGNLTCDSSTLWNHSIICQLTIDRFGTGACFEWDMGDNKSVVYYQDGYCAADVPATSPVYVQVR